MAYDPVVCGSEYGIVKVDITDKTSNRLQFERIGAVGAAGNSGFQALNLAAQFGADRVLLIGFDMHGRGGEHWYGRNNWGFANNPTEDNYRRWRAAFAGAADDLSSRGVDVINASPLSDLKCFRRAGVGDALEAWGI